MSNANNHGTLIFRSNMKTWGRSITKHLRNCSVVKCPKVVPLALMLKMIGHIERLEGLGFFLRKELAIDVVLQSLPNSYSQFVMNYNIHDFEKSLPELLNMLRTAEQELSKNKSTILMVRKDKKGKGKEKSIVKPTSKSLKPKGGIKKPKVTVPKEGECFHCNKPGHWRRNCPLYLQEKKKGNVSFTSGTKKD